MRDVHDVELEAPADPRFAQSRRERAEPKRQIPTTDIELLIRQKFRKLSAEPTSSSHFTIRAIAVWNPLFPKHFRRLALNCINEGKARR